MNKVLFLLCFIFCVSHSFSQKNLNDYSYIVVPQQFEFQVGKDQFRLNTLVRHLLNQNGFNALYLEELQDMPRCEGLYLDVVDQKSFLQTKLFIVIKDCNGVELFRTKEGSSSKKAHAEAYQEAIRDAFASIEYLKVQQREIKKTEKEVKTPSKSDENKKEAVIDHSPILTKEDTQKYQHNGTYFLLATNNLFYKVGDKNSKMELIGKLKPTTQAGILLFTANNNTTLAKIDANKNLVIDVEDEQGNLSQKVYKLVD